MMIAVLSAAVIGWGLWVMFKPHVVAQPAESLQNTLFDHVKSMSEVYYAHENYAQRLHNDTCAILVYRYTPNMCNSCYLEDLFELKEFQKDIGRDVILVLPAYSSNDRSNRIRMANETEGFKCQNIPVDSLALPLREGEGEGALNY